MADVVTIVLEFGDVSEFDWEVAMSMDEDHFESDGQEPGGAGEDRDESRSD